MSDVHIAFLDKLPNGVIVQINEHCPSEEDVRIASITGYNPHHYYCAYIAVPMDLDLDLYKPDVHGGITYGDDGYESKIPLSEHIKGYKVIGWDYAHGHDTIEEYNLDVVKKELFDALADIYGGE